MPATFFIVKYQGNPVVQRIAKGVATFAAPTYEHYHWLAPLKPIDSLPMFRLVADVKNNAGVSDTLQLALSRERRLLADETRTERQ